MHNHLRPNTFIMHEMNVGMKRGPVNENSSNLWYKRLGHILRERTERLVKDVILTNIDFTDFGVCIGCIKGK